jgi:hypothetical protein
MTLYADANSSYDVPHAIGLGRLMEEHDLRSLRNRFHLLDAGGADGSSG